MSDNTALPNKYTSGLFKNAVRITGEDFKIPETIELRRLRDDAPWPGELEGYYVWDGGEMQYKFEKASNEESTS